jgi:hypothetical protein
LRFGKEFTVHEPKSSVTLEKETETQERKYLFQNTPVVRQEIKII